MKALIKPREYFDPAVFEKEQEKLFKSTWNFVGFLSDFENINDFVALSIGGIPIVVQKTRVGLKAFKNVCSHRHSIIQTEAKGNRPMMCPYHGWTYNEKGVPRGIPKKPLFSFTEDELECLKLQEFLVETCGSLVFVRISNSGASLKEFIGDYFDEIELMSNNFGKLIDINEMKIAANWKVVVENTLESYHVALIHADTLQKLGPSGMDFQFSTHHSSWKTNFNYSENEGKNAKIHRSYQDRDYKLEGYKHIILFPNVLISTTFGVSFNLSHIIPLDGDHTLFRSFVFTTKKRGEGNPVLEKVYEETLTDFNRKVFDEDKVICQEVQKGVKASDFDGQLSDEEQRVCHFQEQYVSFMK